MSELYITVGFIVRFLYIYMRYFDHIQLNFLPFALLPLLIPFLFPTIHSSTFMCPFFVTL